MYIYIYIYIYVYNYIYTYVNHLGKFPETELAVTPTQRHLVVPRPC